MKVQADTLNGVYRVEEFESSSILVDGSSFLSRLQSCKDNEVLAAELTEDQAILVDQEYGIY